MNEAPDWLINPQPPDDPDENAEVQEWIWFENGKMMTTFRRNPNYKPSDESRTEDPF